MSHLPAQRDHHQGSGIEFIHIKLKSHIKRNHPAHAVQFEETIKIGSIRGKHKKSSYTQSSEPPAKKINQSTISEAFNISAAYIGVRGGHEDCGLVRL